jgi:cell wall assembly regulator SMI1
MFMSDTWIQDAIKNWEADNTNLNAGSDLNSIISLEKALGIKLPADFKEFYLIVDGFKNLSVNNNLFCIWPIEKIATDYVAFHDKNFIGFCDYLMDSHWIGFHKTSEGVFNDFDLEKPITGTFKEFIKFINSPLFDPRFVSLQK